MEIIAMVAKWSFIVVGIILVIVAAFSSAAVGFAAIYAAAETILRSIRRKMVQSSVGRPPMFPRPPVGPAARKR